MSLLWKGKPPPMPSPARTLCSLANSFIKRNHPIPFTCTILVPLHGIMINIITLKGMKSKYLYCHSLKCGLLVLLSFISSHAALWGKKVWRWESLLFPILDILNSNQLEKNQFPEFVTHYVLKTALKPLGLVWIRLKGLMTMYKRTDWWLLTHCLRFDYARQYPPIRFDFLEWRTANSYYGRRGPTCIFINPRIARYVIHKAPRAKMHNMHEPYCFNPLALRGSGKMLCLLLRRNRVSALSRVWFKTN